MKFKLCFAILLILFSSACLILWNYRFGNPGKINVLSKSEITDGSVSIILPIDENSIFSGYYQDGGTLMIKCIDANGKTQVLCINHMMGRESEWGDVYYGVVHPTKKGGINLGKSKDFHKFIYSVAILDKNLDFLGNMPIDYWYPKISKLVKDEIDEYWGRIRRIKFI